MKMSIEYFLSDTLHMRDREAIKKLSSCGEVRHLKKNRILFHQDDPPSHMAFLLNGIMRSFIFDLKGMDLTECFDYEFGWPVVPSVPMTAPASVNIEASVDSELILFPVADIMEFISKNSEVAQIYHSLMCSCVQKHVRLTRALNQFTAAQRYEWFLSEYAALNGRISNKDIASFLNMSPVTLSHIRKEYRLKQNMLSEDC